MTTVTMLEFRKNAANFLERIAKGESFVLSHRGKPAARLEPVETAHPHPDKEKDPFLNIGKRATPSPKGPTNHNIIDSILYGSK